jgi:ubiquinone/menaquinone biosynthesis C-methylase UbiE
MGILVRRGDPYKLLVTMTDVRMGDRLLHVGCAHGNRFGAVVAKVGLSGHAAAIAPDDTSAERARRGAESTGALVDIQIGPLIQFPQPADSFDLAIVDDTGGLAGNLTPEIRVAMLREVFRVVRPGGRAIVLGAAMRGGFGAIFTRVQSGPGFDAVKALEAEGFKSVRALGEGDGLTFVEGIKPRAQ